MDLLPLLLTIAGSVSLLVASFGVGSEPAPPAREIKTDSDGDGKETRMVRPASFRPQWLGIGLLLAAIAIELGTGPHLDALR